MRWIWNVICQGLLFLFLICPVMLYSQKYLGTWVGQSTDGKVFFILKANGTMSIADQTGTYRITGNRMVLTIQGENAFVSFTISGQAMKVWGKYFPEMSFLRVGAPDNKGDDFLTDDPKDMTPKHRENDTNGNPLNDALLVLGKWKYFHPRGSLFLVFSSEGIYQMKVPGIKAKGTYQVRGNRLILKTASKTPETWHFKVSSQKLIVWGGTLPGKISLTKQ